MPTSFAQWWNALLRHRLIAVLSFAAVMSLTVCVILFSTRSYRSTSRLLLRIGHESATIEPTAAITGDMITPLQTRENEIETALGVMQSRTILEEVVDNVGIEQILKEKPPAARETDDESQPGMLSRVTGPIKEKLANIDPVSARETAIRALQSGFDISAPSKSSVVTVAYNAKHPAVAQNIVGAWVDSYVVQHSKVNRTQGTYRFFVEQDGELKTQLDAAHRELREAKTLGGFATLEGQQKSLEAQLETVQKELLQVDADLVESASRVESVGNLLTNDVDATTIEEIRGLANEARDEMRGLLFQLEVLENEYGAKYKESHPKLTAIRNQLAEARRIVDSQESEHTEFRESANPTHQQLSEKRLLDVAAEKALSERREILLKQQQDLIQEISKLNGHEETLARLTRNVEMLEERYKLHAVRLEQARLDELLEQERITSINVIQPASFEQRPVAPDKKLCAVLGLFAALAVAVSLPVLLDVRTQNLTDRRSAVEVSESPQAVAAQPSVPGSTIEQGVLSDVAGTDAGNRLPVEATVGSATRPR